MKTQNNFSSKISNIFRKAQVRDDQGFSHHLLSPLLALVAVGAIGMYLLHLGSAAVPPRAAGPATTNEFVSLTRGDIMGRRFLGDGGQTVRTSNGYTVSFFGDSLVYKADIVPTEFSDANQQETYMMRNNALIIDPLKKVKSAVPSSNLLAKKSFAEVPLKQQLAEGKNYYWPAAAATDMSTLGKGRTIYVFLTQLYTPNTATDAFNFQFVRSKMAKYYLTDTGRLKLLGQYNTPTYLKDTKPIQWGSGLLIQGDWAYIYGANKPQGDWVWGFDHYIARVKTSRMAYVKEWRYWDGAGWRASQLAAKPIVDNPVGAEGSITVSRNSTGQYTFVYQKFGFIGKKVYRATAPSPQGPWTFPEPEIGTPVLYSDTDYTYCAYEIPLANGTYGSIVSHGNSVSVPFEQQGIHALL